MGYLVMVTGTCSSVGGTSTSPQEESWKGCDW